MRPTTLVEGQAREIGPEALVAHLLGIGDMVLWAMAKAARGDGTEKVAPSIKGQAGPFACPLFFLSSPGCPVAQAALVASGSQAV